MLHEVGDTGLAGVSRREPASTYAAIETERAAGSRALITRGPAGSAVRSNIRPMVQEAGPATQPQRRGLGRPGRAGSAARTILIERCLCRSMPPSTSELEGHHRGPEEGERMTRGRSAWCGGPGGRVVLAGACSSSSGSAAPSGRRGVRRRVGRMRRHRDEGRQRGPPDPGDRIRQVQRRDGPHRAARRRRLEPGPLRGPAVPVRARRRTPTSRTSSSSPRAPTPSRSSAAWRARASTSSSARRSATWTRWRPSPRSSRTSTFLHLTGYKSNGKNFGNFFGAVEDMKYLAGMLAGSRAKAGRQPEDRLHGHLPDPGGAPPRQRDHARRQADLPRVHDGRPLHQHLA